MGLLMSKHEFFLPEQQLANQLKGKKALIVGGTAGIGRSLALSLLKRGVQVEVVGRRDLGPELQGVKLHKQDLSLMRNATQLAEKLDWQSYDLIVFSNGIISYPERVETSEGVEIDMAVSYLSRFAMTKKLVQQQKSSNKTWKQRIFVIGFPGTNQKIPTEDFNSQQQYKAWPAHMKTVVANEQLVNYIKSNSPNTNVYGLSPGLIATEIRNNFLGKGGWVSYIVETLTAWLFQSADQYSERVLVYLMASPILEARNGQLIGPKGGVLQPNPSLTPDVQKFIVDESDKLLKSALAKKI